MGYEPVISSLPDWCSNYSKSHQGSSVVGNKSKYTTRPVTRNVHVHVHCMNMYMYTHVYTVFPLSYAAATSFCRNGRLLYEGGY